MYTNNVSFSGFIKCDLMYKQCIMYVGEVCKRINSNVDIPTINYEINVLISPYWLGTVTLSSDVKYVNIRVITIIILWFGI